MVFSTLSSAREQQVRSSGWDPCLLDLSEIGVCSFCFPPVSLWSYSSPCVCSPSKWTTSCASHLFVWKLIWSLNWFGRMSKAYLERWLMFVTLCGVYLFSNSFLCLLQFYSNRKKYIFVRWSLFQFVLVKAALTGPGQMDRPTRPYRHHLQTVDRDKEIEYKTESYIWNNSVFGLWFLCEY